MLTVFGRAPRPSGSRVPAGRRIARLVRIGGSAPGAGHRELARTGTGRSSRGTRASLCSWGTGAQPPGDLLRRPASFQFLLHHRHQPRQAREPGGLRTLRSRPRRPIRVHRAIASTATVVPDLTTDRRRRPAQPARDRPERPLRGQTTRDLLPLHQRQPQFRSSPRGWLDATTPFQQITHRRRVPTHLPRQHLHRLPRPPTTPHLIHLDRRQRCPRHNHHIPSTPKETQCCDDPLRPPA